MFSITTQSVIGNDIQHASPMYEDECCISGFQLQSKGLRLRYKSSVSMGMGGSVDMVMAAVFTYHR